MNLLRTLGVASATKSAIHAQWEAGTRPPETSTTVDPAKVDDGVAYLIANGFSTLLGDVVTATNVDADGKPARLRRKATDQFSLELLPPGERRTEGTP